MTAANAHRLQCRLVAEGANGPTSLEGDAILRERGIPVLPDILTNAGGVTVSYFEWVQDLGRLFWGRDEIRAKLAEKMNDAFDRVWEISSERGHPPAHRGARDRESATSAPPSRLAGSTHDAGGRVRDAMIADPRSLPGTASAQEAGHVLTPPEVRAVYVVDEAGALTGVLTRKTLVVEGRRRRARPAGDARSGSSPRSRTTRSTPTSRSTRPSASSRSTTPSVFPSWSTAASSACSHAACCSGGSPRTRSSGTATAPATSRRRGGGVSRGLLAREAFEQRPDALEPLVLTIGAEHLPRTEG